MRMIAMCAWRKSVHGGAVHGARHACVAAACWRGQGRGEEAAGGENRRKRREGERHGARGEAAAAAVVAAAARGELAWHPFTAWRGGRGAGG